MQPHNENPETGDPMLKHSILITLILIQPGLLSVYPDAAADRAREKEIKEHFDFSFNDIADKLVTISCTTDQGRSSGSGFIATLDGKT